MIITNVLTLTLWLLSRSLSFIVIIITIYCIFSVKVAILYNYIPLLIEVFLAELHGRTVGHQSLGN